MTPAHTLDQLAVLDAIATAGSFAGAARALHRVPSAVSHAVATLEEALGVPLFDRSGHRAALTPAGQRILELARHELGRAAALEAVARQLRDGWEPELRVVVDGALPMGPVVAGLAALAESRAPTLVRIDAEAQDGVRDRFDDDDADVMFTLELDRGRAGLDLVSMPPLPFVLVVAARHPLAGRSDLERADLRDYPDLVVRDSSPRLARVPRGAFLGNTTVMYVSDFATKRAALRAGVGFGWIPEHLVAADLAEGSLVPVGLREGHRWVYEPHLATRSGRPGGRARDLFIAAVRAAW